MSQEHSSVDYSENVSVVREHAGSAVSREKPEPSTGQESVSLWAFLLCSIFLLLGGGYLGANSGGFSMSQFTRDPYVPTPPDDLEQAAPPPMDVIWMANGKRKFAACAGCHQGNGAGNAQYPPLAGSEWVTRGTEPLAMIILNGLVGPITVAGKTWNAPGMKNWENDLSDEDIAQIMTYIRTAWGNEVATAESGDPDGFVTAEMVAAAREKHGGKPDNHVEADFAGLENSMLPGDKPSWAPSMQQEEAAE